MTGASSDGNYPNFVSWIAKQGGGLYQQASNSDQIILAMTKILNQIRAANSVFSSASLPVSANTQGTYLNQVFIGMFRPDGNALPRWVGNLKQYQFVYDPQRDTLQLADISLTPAVSPTSGFIDSGRDELLDPQLQLLDQRRGELGRPLLAQRRAGRREGREGRRGAAAQGSPPVRHRGADDLHVSRDILRDERRSVGGRGKLPVQHVQRLR